jgi:hypothetical protein
MVWGVELTGVMMSASSSVFDGLRDLLSRERIIHC